MVLTKVSFPPPHCTVLVTDILYVQIRLFASKVVHSSTILLPAWKARVSEAKLPARLLPRDVRTRWNSTYDMLTAAIQYQKVIDAMCADKELGLRKLELTSREWMIATQLADVLKDATAFFSRGTPNLATVIPAMDSINSKLATKHRDTAKYDYAIRTAMGFAKRTLNKYYELTDTSAVYRIAMSEL
ncbi:uncharacterized protein TRAVEDRAFT_114433 [Trametes versicolor FP-101664 SS1]|uniref:uncharacterized protein n=1 Tax=Trametes versicolor (strain FP-101664) TaxID=717944 RepID=UPI0004621AF1|nr:uncharacterized protein TRAVEDRAFT_114433 [Trametes versicolor FP-101664 SS1]EIW62754.1 hypothetical protein TRAVEDRAFT_114433 [Trametes versicolor FP-101664 SS1]